MSQKFILNSISVLMWITATLVSGIALGASLDCPWAKYGIECKEKPTGGGGVVYQTPNFQGVKNDIMNKIESDTGLKEKEKILMKGFIEKSFKENETIF